MRRWPVGALVLGLLAHALAPPADAADAAKPDALRVRGRLTEAFAYRLHDPGDVSKLKPQALEEVQGKVQIIDVREPDEFAGSLGHIARARLIPLGELERRAAELASGSPVVTVCRSGARSAQAAVILQRTGVGDVANLSGGMLRWRAEGHGVVGGQA